MNSLTLKRINIYIYIYITVLPLPTPCPFPLYGIRAILYWPVNSVVVFSVSPSVSTQNFGVQFVVSPSYRRWRHPSRKVNS